MLRTIFASKITKNGFVTHRCAQFFAEFARYAQDFFPVRAGAPQQRCATLRWHRRDTNGSCHAFDKIEKRDKKKICDFESGASEIFFNEKGDLRLQPSPFLPERWATLMYH